MGYGVTICNARCGGAGCSGRCPFVGMVACIADVGGLSWFLCSFPFDIPCITPALWSGSAVAFWSLGLLALPAWVGLIFPI